MEKEKKSVNSENYYGIFRCTTKEYAETFLSKGEIKFNTPNSWVRYALENGEGRGDKLEGTIAKFHMFDIKHLKELNDKYKNYSDLMSMRIDQDVYLKKARDMDLPCFCFYILKANMFNHTNKNGKDIRRAEIPASYFKDFKDNLDPCEVNKLDENKKPAVIYIGDYQEFEQKIITALKQLGVKEEEIIITPVKYFDFKKYNWFDFGQKPPMELAFKDKRFQSQNEERIIINTNDIKIKEILEKPIHIGSLENIASVTNVYFHGGALIELRPSNK